MRYERFMRALDQTRAKYEAEIRKLLREMAQEDATIEQAILKKPAPKTVHWTQTPKGKRRLAAILKARHAKTKS